MPKYKYTCRFCGKHFMHEGWYLKHECKEMKRDAEMKTPLGQAAWRNYQIWMSKRRYNPRGIHTFMTSRFYNAFIKFTEFAKRVSLPEPEMFITFAIHKKYNPTDWTADTVYREYLEHIDRTAKPLDRMADTTKVLMRLSNEYECEIGDLFEHLTVPEVIHMIYTRQFSPWVLLNSDKFLRFYLDVATPSEKVQIDQVIRVQYWKEQFKKHPSNYADIKRMVRSLNL